MKAPISKNIALCVKCDSMAAYTVELQPLCYRHSVNQIDKALVRIYNRVECPKCGHKSPRIYSFKGRILCFACIMDEIET